MRQELQPDPQATTNALLRALLQSPNGSSATFNPPSFKPAISGRIVNGIWFCSLFFSLLSALGASLAKSWVAEYAEVEFKPEIKANAEEAHRRHLRFLGISNWHLTDFIMSLPILLHTAFFFFAIGLSVLLLGDDKAIGIIISALTAVTLILYLGAVAVPLVYADCPYQTPITTFLIRFAGILVKSEHRTSPSVTHACKAQLLLWLFDLCDKSTEIERAITAIAGLDPSPDTQDKLHSSSFAYQLCHHLSRTDPDSNSPMLKAYLYAILQLLRTGFPRLGSLEEHKVRPSLIKLVDEGGLLHNCDSLAMGVQEIAICIKARIVLLYELRSHERVFNVTIPSLLHSTTDKTCHQMLQEVHVLHLGPNAITLKKLHGENTLVQKQTYYEIEKMEGKCSSFTINHILT